MPKVNLGLKAGMNIAKLKSDFADEDNRLGYQGGAWLRIGAAGFYIQPEAYLGSKGGKFNFQNDNNTASGSAKVKFTNLDVPILLGTKIGTNKLNARFMAGPVISFVVDKNTTFSNAVGDVSDFNNYKDRALGGQIGAGVDLGNISIDLRYEAGLSNVNQSDKYDLKQNLWHISLGYKLF
jgi:hypothetical protein